MKKVKILQLCLVLLATGLMPGCGEDLQYSKSFSYIESGEEVNFFVLADPHYLSRKIYDDGEAFRNFFSTNDGKLITYSDELLELIIHDIKEKSPDFVVVAGDLTCSGDKVSHIELTKVFDKIEALGTNVYVVPGNHDIQNPWAREFEGEKALVSENLSAEEWKEVYYSYGYDKAISEDKDSFSYLVTPSEDLWLLMLDSTILTDSKSKSPIKGGELPSRTLKWIVRCGDLAKKNNANLVAVMHHSLLDHSEIFNVDYTINNSKEVLEVFYGADIQLVLTGHIHVQDIKSHEKNGKEIYDVGTNCLCVYPHQYGIVNFSPSKGYFYNTEKIDLKTITGRNGDDLESFENYSINLFIEQCCNQYSTCISAMDELSDEELKEVYDVIVEMNKMYFSGYRNEALDHITSTEGFKMLEKMSPCFAKKYVMSMLNDGRNDNNKLFIPIE